MRVAGHPGYDDDSRYPETVEPFTEWLARQIAAAHAQYEATTTPGRKRRHWDQFLLLTGVQAEYMRRIR